MQVLFPPSYACYLPSRCCGGASYVVDNCIVLGGWQLHCARWLAMYCAGWLASVWPGGSVSVFPPCLCGQGRSLLWKVNTANPDTFIATFSIFLQHFPYFCIIFHIFATNIGDFLNVLVKSCSLHLFLAKNIFRFVSIMIIFPEQWVPWKWYCIVITLFCPRNQLNVTYSVILFRIILDRFQSLFWFVLIISLM